MTRNISILTCALILIGTNLYAQDGPHAVHNNGYQFSHALQQAPEAAQSILEIRLVELQGEVARQRRLLTAQSRVIAALADEQRQIMERIQTLESMREQ